MRDTIITPDDVRDVRAVSKNLSDINRLQPYIVEAETLDVMPALSPAVYRSLLQVSPGCCDSVQLLTSKGCPINVSAEDVRLIMCGGYYCNGTKYTNGLISAVAYLAYRRMIADNSINVTSFGVTVKKSEFSTPAEDNSVLRMSNSAKKIGLEYLRQTVELLKHLEIIECGCTRPRSRRIIAIGK